MNYSDRYTAIKADIHPPGASPHAVAESIRQNGLISEELLPFSSDIQSLDDFLSYKGGNKEECDKAATEWLKDYDMKHEWVFAGEMELHQSQSLMMSALKYSPLGAAVYAWAINNDGLYYSPIPQPNHWICVYGYEEGKYWKIFDSYDSTHKRLIWDFDFYQVKKYYLEKKNVPAPQLSWWKKLLAIFGIKW